MKFNAVVGAFEGEFGDPTESNNGGHAWRKENACVVVAYPMIPSPDDPDYNFAELTLVRKVDGKAVRTRHIVAETTDRPESVECRAVDDALSRDGRCSFAVALASAKRVLEA